MKKTVKKTVQKTVKKTAQKTVKKDLKPKVSVASRIHRQQQDDEPKGKKMARDIGKLTEVLNMPLDVFFECISHLKPIDVLQLARTSKELRGMLMSRSSRHIWIAARKNVVPRLPDCPDYLSEAQYAHLVFERTCDACGVNKSVNVDYAIPGRFCGACWKENCRNGGKLAREAGVPTKMRDEIYNLLPVAHMASYSYYQDPATELAQTSSNIYYEPEYTAVATEYMKLSKSKKAGVLQAYIDERKADAVKRWNFNLLVAQWERGLHDEAQKVEEDARKARVAEIEAKLKELGYDRSDFPTNAYAIEQMMDQPRKLTTRIWNTIRPRIIEILDEERERRALESYRAKWQKRRDEFKMRYHAFLRQDRDAQKRILPGFEDVMAMCEDILTGVEPEVDVTDEEYAALQSRVLQKAGEYRARVLHDLAILICEGTDNTTYGKKKTPKAKAPKEKGKGRRKTADDESNDSDEREFDEEAALALLERPAYQFQCNSENNKHARCVGSKSYLGILEHWQQSHASDLWSRDNISFGDWSSGPSWRGGFNAPCKKWILENLNLAEDATMSMIEDALRRGQPVCSCSWTPSDPNFWILPDPVPDYLVLHKLVRRLPFYSCYSG
ncbi:hypothetical protein C2E23DRAFT_928193 [Lenzites betulinus]|nr:hypothetical protein C2E23DRAFT_928193 [Lenzites betulinus]